MRRRGKWFFYWQYLYIDYKDKRDILEEQDGGGLNKNYPNVH